MQLSGAIEVLDTGIPAQRPRFQFARWLVRQKVATASVVVILVFYICGAFAPLIAPYDPNKQTLSVETRYAAPSSAHIFGTDSLGRDMFSRVLYAARTTMIFTVVVVI